MRMAIFNPKRAEEAKVLQAWRDYADAIGWDLISAPVEVLDLDTKDSYYFKGRLPDNCGGLLSWPKAVFDIVDVTENVKMEDFL